MEISLATARCRDCAYYFAAMDPMSAGTTLDSCRYILSVGEPRPCPAGDGCTVFKRMRGTERRFRYCDFSRR